jgi:hypothetical protein
MSKGNLYIKGLALLLTVIAVNGWSIPAVTVESRTVAPDELVTLSVNVTEGDTVAGANLRISGQGAGLNASDGLVGGDGSINNGHSASFNALSSNNDFRSVVYNPTTSTNFSGPGTLHTITGRVGTSLATGATIPFTVDTAASALSDTGGSVISGVTFNSGTLTVATQFPFAEPFDGTTGNGWTYFNNAGGIFEFGNVFNDLPGGSLVIQNPEDRSFGFWIGPTTITQSFRGNLVIHTFNIQSNKSNPLDVQTTRWRGSDNLFHFAHEHVIDPGFQSPTNEGFVGYTLVTEHDNDPNSPNNVQPVWDAYRFNPAGAGDVVMTMDNYGALRYDTSAIRAASTVVIPDVDLSDPGDGTLTVTLGTDIPVSVIIPSRPDDFFQAPEVFLTDMGQPVFGFNKVNTAENESFAFIQKTLTTGPTVAANTMYIADFTLNTDVADTIRTANTRCRVNLVGLEPGSQINWVEGFMSSVNSLAGGTPTTTLDKSPRPGQPSVVSLYMIPSPKAVGALFQFSFDYNENTGPGFLNDAAGRIWVDNIVLRSVPLSSLTPIE